MAKLGTQFELVVADILRALDPNAKVTQGQWVEGPDGRRDIDVLLEGKVDGVDKRIIIECKDYNPSDPVGIEKVDALDSKYRDLGMDSAFICSNAGFTEGALRKGKRVNIGLIGALRHKDKRIRYKIFEQQYIRQITDHRPKAGFTVEGALDDDDRKNLVFFQYEGIPIENWLLLKAHHFLWFNPVVNGIHVIELPFTKPVPVELDGRKHSLLRCSITLDIEGAWFSQNVEVDATNGLYDWIERAVRSGGQPWTVYYKDIQISGGDLIDLPPAQALSLNAPSSGLRRVPLLVVEGHLGVPPSIVPPLDQFLHPDFHIRTRDDIPHECYRSKRDWVSAYGGETRLPKGR